jgi:copper chaperone CopZ
MKLQPRSNLKENKMTKKTFYIENINCQHCTHTIKNELGEIKGVKDVIADVATKKVEVTFEPPATEEKIIETLVEINYPPVKK